MKEVTREFMLELFTLLGEHDLHDFGFWRTDGEHAPITFFVNCNDLFYWGTADCEEITPENLPILQRSLQEVADLNEGDKWVDSWMGLELFVSRVRKMRPQGAAYPENGKYWDLLNACGEEREVNLVNPRKPGQR